MYLDQPSTQLTTQPIWCHVSYPTDRTTATRLGLLSSLWNPLHSSLFPWLTHWLHTDIMISADSRLAPSQWETSLQSNDVSHWLGANLQNHPWWWWHGNAFGVNESTEWTSQRRFPHHEGQVKRSFDVFFDDSLNKLLNNFALFIYALTHWPPGKLKVILNKPFSIWIQWLMADCPEMHITGSHWWWINIGSGNGLLPLGSKPLPEPMLTDQSHHMASISVNELITTKLCCCMSTLELLLIQSNTTPHNM